MGQKKKSKQSKIKKNHSNNVGNKEAKSKRKHQNREALVNFYFN